MGDQMGRSGRARRRLAPYKDIPTSYPVLKSFEKPYINDFPLRHFGGRRKSDICANQIKSGMTRYSKWITSKLLPFPLGPPEPFQALPEGS